MFKGEGLRALALRGAVWSFAGFGLQNLLRLLSNLILTRLLVPEMFGLMALANVFITGLTLLSDVGTTTSWCAATGAMTNPSCAPSGPCR